MSYGAESRPLAIAHRGGMELGPENTLRVFERATALGIGYLETDVRVSADGGLYCFHDDSVSRITGEPGRISRMTAAQVSRLRVGGEPVPTLAEALEAFPEARFTIDLKVADGIPALVSVLKARGAAHRVCVAGAWDGWIRAVRSHVPTVSTALGWRSLTALIGAARTGVRPPRAVATEPFAHVAIRLGRLPVFTERLVAMAEDVGVKVIVWTVNDRTAMERLLEVGVRGLITDRPQLLLSTLSARGWAAGRATGSGCLPARAGSALLVDVGDAVQVGVARLPHVDQPVVAVAQA